jgi:large subunit ribosomal protein L22
MKAFLKNYRHAPRKVRLVTDSVKGKRVDVALVELTHASKKGTEQIKKLIMSAVANAKVAENVKEADLFIENITVDQGMVMRRFMPRARGRAAPIKRESSHVRITLAKVKTEAKAAAPVKSEKVEKTEKTSEVKAAPKKAAKKTVKAPKASA